MASIETLRPAASKHHGQRMTLAEYEALPEEKPYLEYWDGVVVQKAVPGLPHGSLQGRGVARLIAFADIVGGVAATEVHCWFEGHGYLVPDIAYWAPDKPLMLGTRAAPPTLAVEVRSPDQTFAEQRAKCRHMRANGVDVCWLLDPATRTAEVFEGDRDGQRLSVEPTLESAFLPGLALPLSDLFPEA